MWRRLLGLIALWSPGVAMADTFGPMSATWEATDIGYALDARCSGLYFALAELSETGETGNQGDYRETATIFIGISVTKLIESESLSQSDAEIRVVEEVKRYKNQYWQRFVSAGKTGQPDAVLDADIPFCLKRGELHASGKL
jgi:hypothetical protein